MNKLILAAVGGTGVLVVASLVVARAVAKRIVADPSPIAADVNELIQRHLEDALADVALSPLAHLKETVTSVAENSKLFLAAVVTDVAEAKTEPASH